MLMSVCLSVCSSFITLTALSLIYLSSLSHLSISSLSSLSHLSHISLTSLSSLSSFSLLSIHPLRTLSIVWRTLGAYNCASWFQALLVQKTSVQFRKTAITLKDNRTTIEFFQETASLDKSFDSLRSCLGDMSDSLNPEIQKVLYLLHSFKLSHSFS